MISIPIHPHLCFLQDCFDSFESLYNYVSFLSNMGFCIVIFNYLFCSMRFSTIWICIGNRHCNNQIEPYTLTQALDIDLQVYYDSKTSQLIPFQQLILNRTIVYFSLFFPSNVDLEMFIFSFHYCPIVMVFHAKRRSLLGLGSVDVQRGIWSPMESFDSQLYFKYHLANQMYSINGLDFDTYCHLYCPPLFSYHIHHYKCISMDTRRMYRFISIL